MIIKLRKEQVEGARRYNVLDYGITPSESDNTSRLNSLIDLVFSRGGGEIYFPAGVYKFGGTIILKSNITLSGDGWNTKLLQTGLGNLIQIGLESKPTDQFFENIIIKNLYLDCDNPNNGGRGIILYGATSDPGDALSYTTRKISFEYLRIENFGYAGIDVDYVVINVFYYRLWVRKNGRFGVKVGVDCDLNNCFIGENGVKYPNDFYNCGILVAGGDTRIGNSHIWGWGQERGILIDYSSDIHIQNCVIEEHSKEGIFIYNSSTCRIENCYLEDNSYGNPNVYSAIKIVGNYSSNPSVYNKITSCRFGKQIWGGIQASHKYCVEEEGSYVNYTVFEGNLIYKGYQTAPVYFVGSSSISRNNTPQSDEFIISDYEDLTKGYGIWGLQARAIPPNYIDFLLRDRWDLRYLFQVDVVNNNFIFYDLNIIAPSLRVDNIYSRSSNKVTFQSDLELATGILNSLTSYSFRVNNTPVMTVTSGGNVGIRTTSPRASLEVVGNILFDTSSTNRAIQRTIGSNIYTVLEFGSGNTKIVGTQGVVFASTGYGDYATFSPVGNTISISSFFSSNTVLTVIGASGQTGDLQQWQNSSGTALVRITSSGNLGIGTIPSYRLDVNGVIRSQAQSILIGNYSAVYWMGSGSSLPTSGMTAGALFLLTGNTNQLYLYDGTNWVLLSNS